MLKLGCRPAYHNKRTMRSALSMARALDSLGSPPDASMDWTAAVDAQTHGDWGMDGNDQVGDCVIADDAHFIMLRTANTGKIAIPTTAECLEQYKVVTGWNGVIGDPSDQGTSETDDCAWLVKTGFLGHQANATGMIDPGNLDHLRWTIQLFGAVKFGVNLPQSAMDQFNAGQPWTVVKNDGGSIGGHDILGVTYSANGFNVVTWGKLQPVDPAWILKYADEAHALLFTDWINAQGTAPNGFNLANLLADLPEVEAAS